MFYWLKLLTVSPDIRCSKDKSRCWVDQCSTWVHPLDKRMETGGPFPAFRGFWGLTCNMESGLGNLLDEPEPVYCQGQTKERSRSVARPQIQLPGANTPTNEGLHELWTIF